MGFDPVSYTLGRRAGQAEADPLKSWSELQLWLRAGQLGQVLEAGDQLNVEVGGTVRDFDVLGLDEDVPVGSGLSHVLTLQSHDVLLNARFDIPQYLFAVTAEACTAFGWPSTGMPAGTYHVVLDHGAFDSGTGQDGYYQFTTTRPVPVGGGLRHSNMGERQTTYSKSQITGGTFLTYAADTVTTIESDLICTEGTGGTCLGTATFREPTYLAGDYINYTMRQQYGSSRWGTSYLRQLLNSADETLQWVPATIWSRNDDVSAEGFLHRLDPALRAVLCPVRVRYVLCEPDAGSYEDVVDYVKAPSAMDATGTSTSGVDTGPVDAGGRITRSTAYTFWQERRTAADHVKYSGKNAAYWWMSGQSQSNLGRALRIGADGSTYAAFPNKEGSGAAPCLFIG